MSDKYSVYLTQEGQSRILEAFPHMNLRHYWVNHKLYFVNPIFPEIHTNSIEGFWSQMRQYIRRNIPINHISHWLNFFLFKKNVPKDLQYQLILEMLNRISSENEQD